jgi:hypothetical protein
MVLYPLPAAQFALSSGFYIDCAKGTAIPEIVGLS